jgi:hypothetical protein
LHRSHKRKLVVALAVAVVAAFAGGAYAATQSAGPGTRQAFLNDVAKRLHVTPQQLSAALSGAATDQLQAEVKAGRLTQAQASALAQRLKNGATAPLVAPLVPGRLRGLRGFGPVGPLGPIGAGDALPAAASYLGLTRAHLLQQLAGGKSLAQIAAAKGKSVSGLEQAMTAATKSRLDRAAAAKVITQAQEQKLLKQFSSRLSQAVNTKGPPFGLGFLGRFRLPYRGQMLPAPPANGRMAVPPASVPAPPPANGSLPARPPAGAVPEQLF